MVGLATGRLTPGRVVARDFLLDLALVKINAKDLIPATLTPVPEMEIGETVVAIGNPLALKGGSTVTVGVVSALDRSVLTPEGRITSYNVCYTKLLRSNPITATKAYLPRRPFMVFPHCLWNENVLEQI